MATFHEFAQQASAFAADAETFIAEHSAELSFGAGAASDIILRIGRLLPAFHAAVEARGHELSPPAPVEPVEPGTEPEPP